MNPEPRRAGRPRREWQRWQIFAIAVAAVAVIGGVWNVVAAGDPSPIPGPTRTLIIDPSPSPTR